MPGRTAPLPADTSIAILDLDHVKVINDQQGHQAGDRMLKVFAAHLQGAVRRGDIVARWGGEEFLAVLPGSGLDGAAVFTRLRDDLRKSHVAATFSAGIAVLQPDEPIDAAIARADAALYAAKEQGRDRDVMAPSPPPGTDPSPPPYEAW